MDRTRFLREVRPADIDLSPAAGEHLSTGKRQGRALGGVLHDRDQLLGPERVGATVHLQLLRGGTPHEVTAMLTERP